MKRPRVLLVINHPASSFHHIAQQIERHLGADFATEILTAEAVEPGHEYDAIVVFWWCHVSRIRAMYWRTPIALCLFDHYSWRQPAANSRQFRQAEQRANMLILGNERLAREAPITLPAAVCEDGVDTSMFSPRPLPERFTVGWAGRSTEGVGERFNHDLKGLGIIREACRLAGLPLQVADLSAGGGLEHSQMPDWYGGITVYCCASLAEGTPNPVLEALAAGRPVVSTEVGVVAKVLGERLGVAGLLCERAPEDFAKALSGMAAEGAESLRGRARAAREAVSAWDWAVKAEAWREALWTLIRVPRPAEKMPTGVEPGPSHQKTEGDPKPMSLTSPAPARPTYRPTARAAGGLPRILALADVPNWAWGRKTRSLQRWLADRFEIEIAYSADYGQVDRIVRECRHDLYHTFECCQMGSIPQGWPAVTGITAHVLRNFDEKFGAGTVRRWDERAKGFHANSRMLQREAEEYLGHPVWYVPNGVDADFWRRSSPRSSQHLVVGHAARPSPRKGGEIVREACRRLGLDLRTIDRTCRDAFTPEEMLGWYAEIHVLAVSSDMDGTPNPALECASCEGTIVTNPIGNMPEFIDHGRNGLMTERTVDSLTEALAHLQAMPIEEVEEMGRQARATILDDWTWQKRAENYAAMWTECLK